MTLSRSLLHPPLFRRRPGLYLGMAAVGAVAVNVLVGLGPAAQAEGGQSVSVARQLGLTGQAGHAQAPGDLRPLEELAASRADREAAQTAAQQAQAAADQAAVASAAAASAAAVAAQAATAVTEIAHITNSAGPVRPQTQAAADLVVSNVPGADAITLGGTRASATDPNGHPSGLALDYMVLSDVALGQAIVAYHVDHWAELGVEYIIYRQRILYAPDGAWQPMPNRGSPTANHMNHVHVNYLR